MRLARAGRSSTAAEVARSARRRARARRTTSRVRAQHVDVALSAALRDQPSAGAQRRAQAREQALVVGDPVEGGGREDRVHGLLQLQLEQVDDRARRLRPSRSRAASTIDCDASTAITRPRGRRSISASVIRPEPQPASSTARRRSARAASSTSARAPASARRSGRSSRPSHSRTSAIRVVRYHVRASVRRDQLGDHAARAARPARRAASARRPGVLDDQLARRGSPARSARRRPAGGPGRPRRGCRRRRVGSADRARARRAARTGASAARLPARRRRASGCSCAARRWRSTVSTVARQRVAAPRRGHRRATKPSTPALAQPARERVPAGELALVARRVRDRTTA